MDRERTIDRARTPSFQSKPGTAPRTASPTKYSGRDGNEKGRAQPQHSAWHDVLDLCKRGFLAKLENMTDELKQEVKNELRCAVTALRTEVADVIRTHEAPLSQQMKTVSDHLSKMAAALAVPPPQPDFTPVLEQIDVSGREQCEIGSVLGQRLTKVELTVTSSGSDLASMVQRLDDKVAQMEKKADESDEKISRVCDSTEALLGAAGRIARELDSLRVQEVDHREQLGTLLQNGVVEHLAEVRESVLSMDLSEVQAGIYRSRKQADSDFRTVLAEISRIQQALQLDFAQVMADKAVDRSRTSVITSADSPSPSPETFTPLQLAKQSKVARRLREFQTQTDDPGCVAVWTQTDPVTFADTAAKKNKKPAPKRMRTQLPVVVKGADRLAQKAKEASMKPQYSVFDQYQETGLCQDIARSTWFDNITLFVVFLNAVWMAVDTDLNPAAVITEAPVVFLVAENLFTAFFVGELSIRFGAFRQKRDSLRDFWFVFDLCLVVLMIAETWIAPLIMLALGARLTAETGTVSMVKMVRLVKLLKLSRLARLLQAFPELLIIVKGLGFAARSVSIFFAFTVIIVYVFAVALRQILDGEDLGAAYFRSVPDSMNTLLVQSLFPESSALFAEISGTSAAMWPIIFIFLLLISVTVMYMLVGVLVEVVGVVSNVEKERATVGFVADSMRAELDKLGYQPGMRITKYEFEQLLVEPQIAQVVDAVGVDVVILCDMLEIIYEDALRKGQTGMSFEDVVELVLSMRGSNPATVKDVKEVLRINKIMLYDLERKLTERLRSEVEDLKGDIQEWQNDVNEEGNRQLQTALIAQSEAAAAA